MNNNKKKITTVVLLLAFLAIAVTGGTLAYFTDTDDATNTFVMGNVKIDLVENFDSTKANQMVPGIDVNKDVQIKNSGDSAAYVWYEWLVPAEWIEKNAIHIESVTGKWIYNAWLSDAGAGVDVDNGAYAAYENVNGVNYKKYLALYPDALAKDDVTVVGMDKVYLDPAVDYNKDTGKYTIGNQTIDYSFAQLNIIVRAYAIQAEGLTDVTGDGVINVNDAFLLYNNQV